MFFVVKRKKIIAFVTLFFTLAGTLFVFALPSEDEYIKVPVIMYHSILKDLSRQGKFVVSPDVLKNDLEYVIEKGYTAITVNDLLDYVYENKPLPPKPVIFTFDDGYYNNMIYAYEIFKEHNLRFVISIVGDYTDKATQNGDKNAYWSYLSWDMIREMNDSKIVEFQNHSYDLHKFSSQRKGAKRAKGETQEEYERMLYYDVMKMQNEIENNTGYKATCFTYPFGSYCKESVEILKNLGFKATLGCEEGINKITKNPDCLFNIKRYNRSAGKSSCEFFDKILE